MKYSYFLFLFSLLLSACQPKEKTPASEKFADFEVFYERFHTDSLFQIEHIIFPLEGLPADVDSITLTDGNFRWQKEDWKMHRRFDQGSNDFDITLTPVLDDIIIEKIVHKSGSYGMIRRFAKINGKWHLIYYAGLNQLRPENNISIEQTG